VSKYVKYFGCLILLLSLLIYVAYVILCIVDRAYGFATFLGQKVKTTDTLAGVGITAGGVGAIAAAVSIGVFMVKFVAEGYMLVIWIFLNIAAAFLSGFGGGLIISCLGFPWEQYDDLKAQLALATTATGLLAIGNVIAYLPKKAGYITLD